MRCFDIELKSIYSFLGDEGKNPTVNCYLPYNLKEMGRESQKRPSIVLCPGGGYSFCSERESEPIAIALMNLGFNVFILNYSVSPHRYPSQLREVAALYEEIYKNCDEWNCDTQKIGIMGFSAGAHLAAHYSNAYKSDAVRALFANSKKPAFTVLCYPVITADKSFAHIGSFENLLGEYPTGEQVEKFSCDKMVTPDTPPTFIWHTAEDSAVPVKNSLVYAEALADNNVPFTLHIYPYGPHGLSTCDALTNPPEVLNHKTALAHGWLDELKKWLKTIV